MTTTHPGAERHPPLHDTDPDTLLRTRRDLIAGQLLTLLRLAVEIDLPIQVSLPDGGTGLLKVVDLEAVPSRGSHGLILKTELAAVYDQAPRVTG